VGERHERARELAEREVKSEKSQVEENPDEEREELQLIYESTSRGIASRFSTQFLAWLATITSAGGPTRLRETAVAPT
jgi:hypothetical protein